MSKKRTILLLSGGIDSTTALGWLQVVKRREVVPLIFDYGQTLAKEVEMAEANARRMGCQRVVTHRALLNWLPGCSVLQGGPPMAEGRSLEEIAGAGTPSSYVPFRNGIFLAYAVAFGEAEGIEEIVCGGNGLESGNYWDDTQGFADAFQAAARIGTKPRYRPQVIFPFSLITKAEIVEIGLEIGVDYSTTWSCYKNGGAHCGVCDSCVQRLRAFSAYGLNLEGIEAGRDKGEEGSA